MAVETWLLLATVAVLALLYSMYRHGYWSYRGVPSPPTVPFLGHIHKSFFVNRALWEYNQENYIAFYNSRKCGLYEWFSHVLVIWDPELIKHVFVKDFNHFTDQRDFTGLKTGSTRDEMVLEMLSLKNGAEWKGLRAVMTPTFTSGKIMRMFPLVCDKADALVSVSMKQAAENSYVDMKNNFERFTMDTIASCAFGIECNSLNDKNAEFLRKAELVFKISIKTVLKIILCKIMPSLFKFSGLSINPPETDFFIDVVKQTIAEREAGKRRGDFLDLLLEARDQSDNRNQSDNLNSKHVLSDISMVAQCLLFIVGGYETTASLLAFSCFLLAKHESQQQRLRNELQGMVAEHGGITYQGIMEAKLLDACLQETLRLYPPAVILERACTKTYKLPGTDLTLKPGDLVQVPTWSIHHDPHHWPDPEAFITDRFLPENKDNIQPFTHLPFGVGPRNCIAMRFALLEAKVALSKLLLEAELNVAPGHEEVALETANGLLRPKEGVVLVLKQVKK